MKVFPAKYLTVELEESYSEAYKVLTQNTDITDNLVSTWTNKEFRGQVSEHGFKVISSEIGRGALCVFIGNFEKNIGTIEIRIHKVFQVLLGIILSYPLLGFGLILFQQGMNKSLQFIPIFILYFLVIRYVFIGLSFRVISNTGLKKLTKMLNILNLK